MRAEHFEVLVEEPSMEAFLAAILPMIIGDRATFAVHVHQGKSDLLKKLGARLRAYAKWLPENMRIVVLVDEDREDCLQLKRRLEKDAALAGLHTRASRGGPNWQVVNRIAVEELEAWFFGEWAAVQGAFPGVPATVTTSSGVSPMRRDCRRYLGSIGTNPNRHGYFKTGLRKVEAARNIGTCFNQDACISPSFATFRNALTEALA